MKWCWREVPTFIEPLIESPRQTQCVIVTREMGASSPPWGGGGVLGDFLRGTTLPLFLRGQLMSSLVFVHSWCFNISLQPFSSSWVEDSYFLHQFTTSPDSVVINFEQIDKCSHNTWSVFVGFPGSTCSFLRTEGSIYSIHSLFCYHMSLSF